MIRYFIYSLTSRHLHAVIKHRNDESYKRTFDELLKEFSLYLQTLNYCIYDKIHLMVSTLKITELEDDLEKVLLLEPN